MAVQILPRQAGFLEALAPGIASGLQTITNFKLQKYLQQEQIKERQRQERVYEQQQAQQRQAAEALRKQRLGETSQGLAALGLPPEYANLDPSILREVVKQKYAQPSQETYAKTLSAILGGGAPEVSGLPPMNAQQQQFLQQLSPADQQQLMQELAGQQQMTPLQSLTQSLSQIPSPELQQELAQPAQPQAPQITPPGLEPQLQAKPPVSPAQAQQQAIAQALAGGRLNEKQATQLAKFASQRQQIEQKERQFVEKLALEKEKVSKKEALETRKEERETQKEINKETKAVYDEVLKEDKAAYEADKTLKKMTSLIEKGKLPPAAAYKLFKDIEEKFPAQAATLAFGTLGGIAGGPIGAGIGGAIGGLISPIASLASSGLRYAYPDTEEFEKLSNSFIRGAKAVFGARITDQDLRAFLATVPTLAQTDAGKKAIIKNMENLNAASHVRSDVLKQILKENKGKRPENLPILIEERAKPELDRIADEFIGIARKAETSPIPQTTPQQGPERLTELSQIFG